MKKNYTCLTAQLYQESREALAAQNCDILRRKGDMRVMTRQANFHFSTYQLITMIELVRGETIGTAVVLLSPKWQFVAPFHEFFNGTWES
jgi:hypothetical protein